MIAKMGSAARARAHKGKKDSSEKAMPCHNTAPMASGRPAPMFWAMSTPT